MNPQENPQEPFDELEPEDPHTELLSGREYISQLNKDFGLEPKDVGTVPPVPRQRTLRIGERKHHVH
jgi:hypothetical protein